MNIEEDNNRKLPKNRSGTLKVGPFRIRSIVEAVIFVFPIIVTVCIIPFLLKVKIVLITVLGVGVVAFALLGIRNRTVTEYFIGWIKHVMNKRCLSLRSVADENRKNRKNTINRKNSKYSKYFKGIQDFFSEDNLNAPGSENDIKKIVAKGAKQFYTNIKDNIGF